VIEAERAYHPVSRIAATLGVTRAGYHAWKRREPSLRAREDTRLKELLERAFVASHGTYSAPCLQVDLAEQGVHVGRKRIARPVRELGLEGASRRRGRCRPSCCAGEAAAAPDFVRRTFRAEELDLLWLADITYLPTHEGWLVLAVVVDMCSTSLRPMRATQAAPLSALSTE
jgi:putative transposase